MGKISLRDVSLKLLETHRASFSQDEFQMILYVIEEIERTQKAANALKEKNIKQLGDLLFETHNGLSKMYQVSCEELDYLVELAKNDEAVIGSRMMGGGFGGCTINIVEHSSTERFIEQTQKSYEAKFGYQCTSIQINISQGTHLIN
jgi:galactokinase